MKLFIRFFFTGAAGAVLSLAITWALTTFVVGTAHYFSAYLVGIAANLLFNFVTYTLAVFKTKHDHLRRLAVFLWYGVIMAFLQGSTVQLITEHVGVQRYLFVIAGVIAFFAVLNFFVFKLSVFKERPEGVRARAPEILAFVLLCAVLLRVAILFHVLALGGVGPLVYGDAMGYRELSTNLATGNGFATTRAGMLVPEVFRTPGLPLLLAPFAGSDSSLAIYFFVLALLGGALFPYLVYRVGKRFVSVGVALGAAILVAFEPQLVFFSMYAQTEMPFMLFSYGALCLAILAYDRGSYLYAAGAGALLGYAVLIRPGFFPVCIVTLVAILGYQLWKERTMVRYGAVIVLLLMVVLAPWYVRTHEITGVYALSGAGWRNVYTDYLASVRAIEHHTDFSSEKHSLKQDAEAIGVPTDQVDNPAYGKLLRNASLKELWAHKVTVLKLEPVLLFSFFTQDGYYYQFKRLYLVPNDEGSHTSATFALLNKGVAGIRDVIAEAGRQLFIPILGRLFTIGIFLAALIGFFFVKTRMRYAFALIIALSALTATAIGLGVEARLRLPVEPLLFLFAVAACVKFLPVLRFPHEA
ncbi:MAG: hypothetical protein JWL82_457 [Parcubacteria group bacterium]|nr:hypothetical protein [Parcubacteria group bacterium]